MAESTYLDKIKRRLYIAAANFDDEILSLVEAARIDMVQSGVKEDIAQDEENDNVLACIVAYVKAYRGNDPTQIEPYSKVYKAIRDKMTMIDGYKQEG